MEASFLKAVSTMGILRWHFSDRYMYKSKGVLHIFHIENCIQTDGSAGRRAVQLRHVFYVKSIRCKIWWECARHYVRHTQSRRRRRLCRYTKDLSIVSLDRIFYIRSVGAFNMLWTFFTVCVCISHYMMAYRFQL